MFTGIVREVGRIVEVTGDRDRTIELAAPTTARASAVGDSVSVAGVCLTAEAIDGDSIRFHAVAETLGRTTLGRLGAGATVNVEPALRAGEPLGGHLVQGHVDAVGNVRSVAPDGDGARLTLVPPAEILRYCVEKGSMTVDGVSLTIAQVGERDVEIALVPHTLAATTLGGLSAGDSVNLEVDVIAKYVERLLSSGHQDPTPRDKDEDS